MCNAPLVTLLAVDDDALKRVDNSLGKRALSPREINYTQNENKFYATQLEQTWYYVYRLVE